MGAIQSLFKVLFPYNKLLSVSFSLGYLGMNYVSNHEPESIHTHWYAIHLCISIDNRGCVAPYMPSTIYGISTQVHNVCITTFH